MLLRRRPIFEAEFFHVIRPDDERVSHALRNHVFFLDEFSNVIRDARGEEAFLVARFAGVT